jgi:hypothetical protein
MPLSGHSFSQAFDTNKVVNLCRLLFLPSTNKIPINELPIKELPINELPINELPIKELPIKELPINKRAMMGQGTHEALFPD